MSFAMFIFRRINTKCQARTLQKYVTPLCTKGQSSSSPEYLFSSAACNAGLSNRRISTTVPISNSTFRAVVCEELGKPLVVKDIVHPPLKDNEVRLESAYSGINHADILKTMGLYQERPDLPFIPGSECAGTVIEVGRDVTRFQKGDRVVCLMRTGGFGEIVDVSQTMAWKLPDDVSYRDAATSVVSYGTAHMALLWKANTKPGDTVLISGAAGGVGLAAVEIAAKIIGATVIAIAGDDEKLALTKEKGATHIINHQKQDVKKEILAITKKKGVDVVIDNVGGDMFELGLRCIAFEGRIVTVGYASGVIPKIPANILLVKNISVLGVFWSNYELECYEKFDLSISTVLRLCSEGKIQPHFSAVYPFDKTNQAYKFVLTRKSTGKVLLYPKD